MAGENESTSQTVPKQEGIFNYPLEKLRKVIKSSISKHEYKAALFWADKCASITNGYIPDLYMYAHCLYLTGQYFRASTFIIKKGLHLADKKSRYLASKCQFLSKDYQQALESINTPTMKIIEPPDARSYEERSLDSAIQLLKGQIYEEMENREMAIDCFSSALHYDVYCYEAFESLVQHHMLTKQEETTLIEGLPFKQQCNPEEIDLIKTVYDTLLKKYDQPGELELPAKLNNLAGNLDIVSAVAERYYYNCDYITCFRLTESILAQDPFHTSCLPTHISCLMELKKSNDLFHLAHRLVDLYPDKAIAWYAVGCYYLLVNKRDSARRFLNKATTLDKVFGPAWLMFGHSFAVENEHDQAMSAYFKASQLMRGCHLPLLYIGLEYGLNNNTRLAERFFNQALQLAPNDPFVLHELGTVAFQHHEYILAEKHFRMALEEVQKGNSLQVPDKWEPLLNNLGHTCRKLKKYNEALEFHRQALVVIPSSASTLSAIGFVHALKLEWGEAVEMLHKALSIQKDDTFSTTMLGYTIDHMLNEENPLFSDLPEVLPPYTSVHESILPVTNPEIILGEGSSMYMETEPSI